MYNYLFKILRTPFIGVGFIVKRNFLTIDQRRIGSLSMCLELLHFLASLELCERIQLGTPFFCSILLCLESSGPLALDLLCGTLERPSDTKHMVVNTVLDSFGLGKLETIVWKGLRTRGVFQEWDFPRQCWWRRCRASILALTSDAV